MRVLFTTWAWPSHYFPMVPVAWALRAAGHEVRMTSQPELVPAMLGSGLPATVIGEDLDAAGIHRHAMDSVKDALPGGRQAVANPRRKADRISDFVLANEKDKSVQLKLRALLALRDVEAEAQLAFRAMRVSREASRTSNTSLYGEVAEAMADDLMALAQSWRPDLVVFDPLTYAGPLVAKALGVPTVRNLFGPDVTYFTNSGEVLGMRRLLERFGFDTVNLMGDATLDPCPPSIQFPEELIPTRRIRTRYVPYNGLAVIPSWLNEPPERPRICLTWGTTMVRMLGEQAFMPHELLQGCIKLADERDAELVLAITSSQRALLPELPEHVKVVESVPLQALLGTCEAIIHQGGAGTMLTALALGLPQLTVTAMPDQAANGINLVASGAGQTMSVNRLDASSVLAAGHDLLDDPSYREAAQQVRQENLDQPTPAEIVPLLEAVAAR